MSFAPTSSAFRTGIFKSLTLLAVLALTGAAMAAGPLAQDGPVGPTLANKNAMSLPVLSTDPLDEQAARAEDLDREYDGLAPRFAIPQHVEITPETDGTWEDLDAGFQLWRLRIQAPGALSLNFGFTGYELPKGSRLSIYPAEYKGMDDVRGVRIFNELDNETHGELWTPVIISNDIIIELLLPTASRNDYTLELTAINRGYRFFGEDLFDKSGSCNVDVVCPEGDDWRSEINSVGVISTGGSTFCTGSMLNNTAQDGAPYFLTANHCGITTSNDQSLVVYWNFQSPTCGQQGGGSLSQYMTGSTHLASNAASDFTLVLMDDPVNPDHNVTFGGWDRSTNDPTSAIAIHHPNTDEKSISFEYDPTSTTTYMQNATPGDGTHIRITNWDLGTTEPGSSGSPLFDQNHRVVGQLHGGYASCTSATSDWYGRLSVSFPSVAQYLDPTSSGVMAIDTFDPNAVAGLAVTPNTSLMAEGDAGGPFTPSSIDYTLENQTDASMNYLVDADVNWVSITNGSGTLYAGETTLVTVALNSTADGLANGGYSGLVSFTNLTNGEGDTTRSVSLLIGAPALVYDFNMDSDPGWTMDGQWAYGTPSGSGGAEHGNSDPAAGATGSQVIGYNLNGDYTNNMTETHMTTTAIDCSDLTAVSLKFKRWLNVEQPTYDHAYLRVSTDGSSFSTIWENTAEVTDNSWVQQEFDISSIADGAETLYIRWTMGTTDGSWLFAGWNVDDVEIWGLAPDDVSATDGMPVFKTSLGNYPNPFNPMTKVSFGIERDGQAMINIYDVQGHLVRHLVNSSLTAGDHQVTWDGRNDAGRQVGSGVYFARLVSGNQVAEHKMVLLK